MSATVAQKSVGKKFQISSSYISTVNMSSLVTKFFFVYIRS